MLSIRPMFVVLLAALLCACQSAPPRHPATTSTSASPPAWRGVAVLADPAQAPRDGRLEVVLVSIGDDGDAKVMAHAEFAVKPAARIDFALPVDMARDAASKVGWRVWLRDASGRLRYASERIVAANRDAATNIPLSRVAPR